MLVSLSHEGTVVLDTPVAGRVLEQNGKNFAREPERLVTADTCFNAEGLRAGGVPPERAVILMKSALSTGLAGSDDAAAEELLHEAVDRGIDAYYAA